MAKYLERSKVAATLDSSTINVLELGSGTGIVGLAVARLLSTMNLKARVVLTDKENVVPLLQRNADKNKSKGINIETRVLDWEAVSGINVQDPVNAQTEEATPQPGASVSNSAPTTSSPIDSAVTDNQSILETEWDLVILSDCIWIPALYSPLIGTINTVVRTDKTNLVLAFEKRNFSEEMEFFAMLGKTFRFRDIKPEEQDPNYQSDDIYLFTCQRRPE